MSRPLTPSAEGPRLDALDGLRGLVLLILFVHFMGGIDGSQLGPATHALFTAVFFTAITSLDVFFVLSGFLITRILIDTRDAPRYFRTFYIRRAIRILPLYYGFLLLYLAVLPRADAFSDLRLLPMQQAPYWLYTVNFAELFHWSLAPYTFHLWTLSIEEQFYLVWPLVVWVCPLRLLRRISVAIVLAAFVARLAAWFAWPDTLMYSTFTLARLDVLGAGALIAASWDGRLVMPAVSTTIRRLAVAAAVVCVGAMAYATTIPTSQFKWGELKDVIYLSASAYVAAGVVVVMLDTTRRRIWHRFAETWALRRIGIYSYALYMLHYPLSHVLDRLGLVPRPVPDASIGVVLWYCLEMTVLSIALAAASWHFVERPLLRLRPRSGPVDSLMGATRAPAARRPT